MAANRWREVPARGGQDASAITPRSGVRSDICNLCQGRVEVEPSTVWHKDGFDIVRCGACGLIFRTPLPTDAELGRIYGDEYFDSSAGGTQAQGYQDYLGEADVHRANAARRLTALRRFALPGRLLDVGCAAGFFVEQASKAGWRATGIDISESMANFGRSKLGQNVSATTFRDYRAEPGAFDCITMWDYIEHSADPAGDLGRAARYLARGGLLALSTGDVESAAARISGSRWHLLTPRHHNFFFSRETLRSYLARFGFDPLLMKHPASVFTVRYLAYKMGTMHYSRLSRRVVDNLESSRIGSAQLPVNLWDVLTVIARRR